MNRLLSMLLIIAMCVTVLSGCNLRHPDGETNDNEDPSDDKSQVNDVIPDEDETQSETEFNDENYIIMDNEFSVRYSAAEVEEIRSKAPGMKFSEFVQKYKVDRYRRTSCGRYVVLLADDGRKVFVYFWDYGFCTVMVTGQTGFKTKAEFEQNVVNGMYIEDLREYDLTEVDQGTVPSYSGVYVVKEGIFVVSYGLERIESTTYPFEVTYKVLGKVFIDNSDLFNVEALRPLHCPLIFSCDKIDGTQNEDEAVKETDFSSQNYVIKDDGITSRLSQFQIDVLKANSYDLRLSDFNGITRLRKTIYGYYALMKAYDGRDVYIWFEDVYDNRVVGMIVTSGFKTKAEFEKYVVKGMPRAKVIDFDVNRVPQTKPTSLVDAFIVQEGIIVVKYGRPDEQPPEFDGYWYEVVKHIKFIDNETLLSGRDQGVVYPPILLPCDKTDE